MRSTGRAAPPAPGSAFLVGLLLVMLVLSAVLAYQAVDAARSEARSTETALRGYAAFATWELARRAETATAARLAGEVERAAGSAEPLAAVAAGMRTRLRAWQGGSTPPELWVVATDPASVAVQPSTAPAALAGWLRGPAAVRLRAARGDTTVVEPVRVAGEPHLVALRGAAAAGGRAIAVVVPLRGVAGSAFTEAFAGTPVLPASPKGALANREALAVLVTAPGGQVVFRAAGWPGNPVRWADAKIGSYRADALAPGEVIERLEGTFAGFTARVAVRPKLAAGLSASDRLPRSRVPLLLTVFALTLALVCVGVVQLRRQQELVRLRDEFVSGVSHELRTPLAQIRLFADLLASERLAAPEQRRRSIRIINEEARRLTYLVENILHFSRAQRGASQVLPAPLAVGPLLREIVDGFAPLARTRDTTFAVALEEGVLARIDPDALRQVLLNLLDNAVKYGPSGQQVRVGMRLVDFAVRIWVDDAGPGVPPDQRARIWEPYRRLQREGEGGAGGSGIGLAVVRDLVSLHGGRAGVADAPGGGARFWVEFPYAMYAGPADSAEAAVEEAVAAGGPA